jgi:bisphosphoglycerate-independent phosphoglycerate mutase (AlkP superfamily)
MMTPPAVLLVIFDGFGLNPSRAYNGWAQARTPHLDHYFASHPHTQHTSYPVPFLLLGRAEKSLSTGRGLADVAPTVLDLLGLAQPPQMTGRSILLKAAVAGGGARK